MGLEGEKTKTTRQVLLASAVSIAVIAVGYSVWHGRVPRPVRITGRTVGPGDQPLADVRVVLEVAPGDSEDEAAIERIETRSDAKGEFSINFIGHWRRATYRLEAQTPGFRKLSIEGADSLPKPVTLRFAKSPS